MKGEKMAITIKKLISIKEEFQKTYLFSEPYKRYTNGCGVSKIKIQHSDVKLNEGESLDDLCLSVYLKEEPPKSLDFPSEYKGVRVFYECVGEFKEYNKILCNIKKPKLF
jgi:hypothetical protein